MTHLTFTHLMGCLLCLLVTTFSLNLKAAGGESPLNTTPVPIATERDAQLSIEDIGDLKGFLDSIRQQADADADSPAGRIWDLLPLSLREESIRWEFEDAYPQELKNDALKSLNQVLRRKDFYNPDVWEGVALSATLEQRLANLETDSPVEISRANRLLLHETYPEMVSSPQKVKFVTRPDRIHLYGDRFLDRGQLKEPIKLWTGAVWQPSFFIFGTYRTSLQTFDDGSDRDSGSFTENPHRLDLFVNLSLTATERVFISFRPLDGDDGFTRYEFDDIDEDGDGVLEREQGFEGEFDLEPETLFIQGDFGELFPFLDPEDKGAYDLGFAIGRQPLFFGNGFIVEDTVDSAGVTINNLIVPGTSNVRITGLYAWDGVNRDRGLEDGDATMAGLFTAVDFPKFSVELDGAYVFSDEMTTEIGGVEEEGVPPTTRVSGGDSIHVGIGSIQRIGHYSTSFRAAASLADEETEDVGDGVLLFADASYTLPHSIDLVYGGVFAALDRFSSAARRAVAQGPLARVGILFEGAGIGRIGPALSNQAVDVAGGALGYQMFFNEKRTQVILEVGTRISLEDQEGEVGGNAFGAGLRFQQAFGQHLILRADAAAASQEEGDARVSAGVGVVVQF